MSGVSKGGWMAYYMSIEPFEGLHGTAIIAAGQPNGRTPMIQKKLDHLAVLVATREADPNYPHAQMAVEFFKQSKIHSFCYEEWLEEGHVSIISPRVIEWLTIQAKRGGAQAILVEYCETVVKNKLESINKLEQNKDKYIALRHLIHAPATHYVSADTKRLIKNFGKKLTYTSGLREWFIDLKKLRHIIKRETKFFHDGRTKPELLESFVKAYQKLAKSLPLTQLIKILLAGHLTPI